MVSLVDIPLAELPLLPSEINLGLTADGSFAIEELSTVVSEISHQRGKAFIIVVKNADKTEIHRFHLKCSLQKKKLQIECKKEGKLFVACKTKGQFVAKPVGDEQVLDMLLHKFHDDAGMSERWSKKNGVVATEVTRRINVNAVNADGRTLLMVAAKSGNVEAVKQLVVSKNIGIDLQDPKGKTALHIACEQGHREIVKLLIHHHASLELRDKQSKTPIFSAAIAQKNEWVDIVMDLAAADVNLNTECSSEKPLLFYVVCAYQLQLVDALLQKGAGITMPESLLGYKTVIPHFDSIARTLITAAKSGYCHLVQAILNSDIKFEEMSPLERRSLLFGAYDNGHLDIVVSLYQHLAGLNVNDKAGLTLEMRAMKDKNHQCIKLLFSNRLMLISSLQQQSSQQRQTPLHYLMIINDVDVDDEREKIITILGQVKGVTWSTKNADRLTPLDLLIDLGKVDLVDYFCNVCRAQLTSSDMKTLFASSVKCADIRMAKQVMASARQMPAFKKIDLLNCPDGNGNTDLHNACLIGDERSVANLLELGAKTEIINNSKKTAYQLAQEHKHMSCLALLREHNAKLNQGGAIGGISFKNEKVGEEFGEGSWLNIEVPDEMLNQAT
ncbi:MAG: ankyrin repeat domain-containing protein [Parashewanella sp.]